MKVDEPWSANEGQICETREILRREMVGLQVFEHLLDRIRDQFLWLCGREDPSDGCLAVNQEKVAEGVRFFRARVIEGELPGIGAEDIDRLAACGRACAPPLSPRSPSRLDARPSPGRKPVRRRHPIGARQRLRHPGLTNLAKIHSNSAIGAERR